MKPPVSLLFQSNLLYEKAPDSVESTARESSIEMKKNVENKEHLLSINELNDELNISSEPPLDLEAIDDYITQTSANFFKQPEISTTNSAIAPPSEHKPITNFTQKLPKQRRVEKIDQKIILEQLQTMKSGEEIDQFLERKGVSYRNAIRWAGEFGMDFSKIRSIKFSKIYRTPKPSNVVSNRQSNELIQPPAKKRKIQKSHH